MSTHLFIISPNVRKKTRQVETVSVLTLSVIKGAKANVLIFLYINTNKK